MPYVTRPEGKFYYPLGIWAVKRPSRTSAVEFAIKYKFPYIFQWQGIGSFVSDQEPPRRRDIIPIISVRHEQEMKKRNPQRSKEEIERDIKFFNQELQRARHALEYARRSRRSDPASARRSIKDNQERIKELKRELKLIGKNPFWSGMSAGLATGLGMGAGIAVVERVMGRLGKRNPLAHFRCSVCGQNAPKSVLPHGKFEERMMWLRSHYARKHPGVFGKRNPMKQPWQMTKQEWYRFLGTPEGRRVSSVIGTSHFNIVREALSEGKSVPVEVLAEYGLAPKVAPAATAVAPKAPVAPEVKPLIDQTYQKRWDTDKLGFRTDLTVKGGWVNNKGQMTKAGEKIAQSKWNDLSPAAQNVLKRLIDERYGVIPKPVVAKEPWQMTQKEFVKIYEQRHRQSMSREAYARLTESDLQAVKREAIDYQTHTIRQALSAGKLVPAEALADYPFLAKRNPIPPELFFRTLRNPVLTARKPTISQIVRKIARTPVSQPSDLQIARRMKFWDKYDPITSVKIPKSVRQEMAKRGFII